MQITLGEYQLLWPLCGLPLHRICWSPYKIPACPDSSVGGRRSSGDGATALLDRSRLQAFLERSAYKYEISRFSEDKSHTSTWPFLATLTLAN
jgi:hypothetical protein